MLNLELIRFALPNIKTPNSIHQAFLDDFKRGKHKSCQGYFNFLTGWLGGRSYNCFLNYGDLLIDIIDYFKNIKTGVTYFNYDNIRLSPFYELCGTLLLGDRHDLYQSLPYTITEFLQETADPEKHWHKLCHLVINNINEAGDGN